jgi:hypothetical protein
MYVAVYPHIDIDIYVSRHIHTQTHTSIMTLQTPYLCTHSTVPDAMRVSLGRERVHSNVLRGKRVGLIGVAIECMVITHVVIFIVVMTHAVEARVCPTDFHGLLWTEEHKMHVHQNVGERSIVAMNTWERGEADNIKSEYLDDVGA